MAKHASSNFGIFVIGGVSMLGAKPKNVTRRVENVLEESHGLGDSWPEFTPVGIGRAFFSQDGALFDDGTNSMHATLSTAPSTGRVGVVAHMGNTLGQPFTGFFGQVLTGYEVLAQFGALTKANATYAASGDVDEGVILQTLAARTVTTTGTAVDNTTSSSSGGGGYLEVTAYSGFTNVVFKIQHSPDNSVWSDLITFTTVTSAPFAQRVEVSGTVNRYTRALQTVSGTGSVTAFVGFARD